MRKLLLSLRGVKRIYTSGEQKIEVLHGIDLDIYQGELVAIIGASGSGKSTLMNILGCLDKASEGSYEIDGVSTSTLSSDQLAALRRNYFGFIFQRYHLLTHLNASSNVEIPAIYAGTSNSERRENAVKLLERLGLGDKTSHLPSQLSGGQQQRVSIARALMNGGHVILADEPTGALDTKSGKEVLGILKELNAAGHTVILVTHDPSIAAHANRVIEIRDGNVISDVTKEDQVQLQDGQPESIAPLDQNMIKSFGALFMRFKEAFKMAWIAMVTHRMRTLLTMLGIIIGIMAVVSVVALGNGASQKVTNDISSIGTNTITIYPGKDWGDMRANKIQTLKVNDLDALKHQEYVDGVSPSIQQGGTFHYDSYEASGRITGVSEQFAKVKGLKLESGRFFDEEHVKSIAQVAVLDQNTKEKFFPNENPIGKVILLGKLPCVVIGVLEKQDSPFGGQDNLEVYIPYTSAIARITGSRYLNSIVVKVRDGWSNAVAEQLIVNFLSIRHGAKDIFTNSSDTILKTIQKTTGTMTLLVSCIAVISLIVGGIGVMNIMLVSVTERTKEIGIRMAVGARKSDILQQFLIEAILVCLIGGFLGIACSYGVSVIFSMFVQSMSMVFSPLSIVAAVTCSTLIGVVFGYLPAKNAARLDPIDALARE
ncbi:MAG: MacB family efflux pump subunit [Succinivibrionaceae bacterium]|jgi:macrolide transport system ATP-binding/permease protein|nr:MacB family efflux pump subunit [Succinivibrionaceae bacterium]